MDRLKRRKLLFIDAYEEWLLWVQSILQPQYDVSLCSEFSALIEMLSTDVQFDLVFVGSDIAERNLASFESLSGTRNCNLVVLFPGFPNKRAARNLLKAGALDVAGKPYPNDHLALEDLISQSIILLTDRKKEMPREHVDIVEYRERTRALAKHLGVALSARPEEKRTAAESMVGCYG